MTESCRFTDLAAYRSFSVLASSRVLGLSCFVVLLALTACSVGPQMIVDAPDLVPVADMAGTLCRLRDGRLLVTVRNQGASTAGASAVEVVFGGAGTVTKVAPELVSGASIELLFDIPPHCFSPDCSFRITVNSTSTVQESNETNNVASGLCLRSARLPLRRSLIRFSHVNRCWVAGCFSVALVKNTAAGKLA